MKMRITMMGAGSVARRHVAVLSGLPEVAVVGVVDPVFSSATALAADCGARAFLDVDEALDATEPDAVYICVPPFAHGTLEKAALARRLPFFVEKPLGIDMTAAEEVARLVEDTGVVTGTGYHWRCLDHVAQAQELLADRPALLASGYWLDKRPPVPWWADTSRSGGQVIEQLTHLVDLARMLLGEAVEAYAAGARLPTAEADVGARGDVDDATAATVRFESGAVATFAATSLLRVKHRAELHTFGSGMAVEVSETALTVDDGATRLSQESSEDPRITVDREFVAAVRGEREATRAPYHEALRSHRLGCAITRSARTGEPVKIEPSTQAVA